MGEAKRKREELREKMLQQAEMWMAPPSAWEAEIVEAILELPSVRVPRASREQLEWMGMPSTECHANVRWYVRNDPTRTTRASTGWWVQGPDFLLHSVLERDGQYWCITPTPFQEQEIEFIPDPELEWQETGDVYSAFRGGRNVGYGVRRYPNLTIARSQIVINNLNSGLHPYKAIELSDEEYLALLKEHVPGARVVGDKVFVE